MADRLREFAARCVAWLRGRRRDRDFDDELSVHIDLAVADGVARGLTPAEARRRALARVGGVDAARERHRDARGLPRLSALGRDLRDAARVLRRSPVVTSVAVLSFALGIGANTTIFSIVNGLVLRELPVRDPSRLVQLTTGSQRTTWTNPLWEAFRAKPDQFDGVVAWGAVSQVNFGLIERGELQPLETYSVSGSFFDVLGVRAARGRLLSPADDVRGGSPEGAVAVISDAFWRRHFAGDENIVGRVLTLSRFPVTVVGVTPPEFFGPEVGRSFDVILPIAQLPKALLDARGFWWVSVMARLKHGQTVDDAAALLRAVQPDLRAATIPVGLRPEQTQAYLAEPFGATLGRTGPSALREKYREPLFVLMTMVALVLLVACANIANLLLARSESRRHEFALRLALGASRGQLARQLIVEALVLSIIGAAAGVLVAVVGGRLLVHQLSATVTLALPLDWRVLGFTAATAVATALLVGVGPATRATRVASGEALGEHGRAIAGRRRWWLGHALVIAQVALSLVLTIGASLLLRTFVSLTSHDLGFDPYPVLSVGVTARPGVSLGDEPGLTARYVHVLDEIRRVPGVRSAAFSGATSPMSGFQHDNFLENPVGVSLAESQRDVFFRDAGRGWFETLGMRIVSGRDFSADDTPNFPGVGIINETLARRFFPGRNPVGQTLREVASPGQTSPEMTIVGVVADAVYNSVREGVPPTLYRFLPRTSSLVVRAANGDASSIVPGVTEAIGRADTAFLVTTRPLADHARASVARERIVAILSGFFGVLALLLAGVGIYGVMAYSVGQRRREIAVRRALGASAEGVRGLIVRRAMLLVVLGIAIGGGASLWVAGRLRPLLYGLDSRDPLTMLSAALVLGAIGVVAAWIPAIRAGRVDPATVLREG